jgi:hypothetical protein
MVRAGYSVKRKTQIAGHCARFLEANALRVATNFVGKLSFLGHGMIPSMIAG